MDKNIKNRLTFTSEYYGAHNVLVEVSADSTIDEVVAALKAFLIAVGYSPGGVKEAFSD